MSYRRFSLLPYLIGLFVSVICVKVAYAPDSRPMPDLSYSELIPFQGTNGANTLINVANAAASVVCNLYENYPTGILPSVGRTPVSDLTEGLLNNLCGPRGQVPPPRSQPFSGGQCECVLYQVDYTFTRPNGTTFSGAANLTGPIFGVVEKSRTVDGTTFYDFFIRHGSINCPPGIEDANTASNFTFGASLVIDSIAPASGGSNACGDPPVTYPPTLPPNNEFNTNVNVTIAGNTFNTPVTIIPTVFAPVTVFRPQFNVDVGGINVQFDLGGISFSPSINPTTNITLPGGDTRPVLPPSKPGNNPECPNVDLSPLFPRFDNIDTQLDEIQECACGADQVVRTTLFTSSESRTVSLPPDTVGVRVIATSISNKIKTQYGGPNAPDAAYLGWCAFSNGTSGGDRRPINYASAFFFAPDRADTFSYTVERGSEARLEVVFLEDVQEL